MKRRSNFANLVTVELRALLLDKWTLMLMAAYTLFTSAIFFNESFRNSRVQLIGHNLFITVTNHYLPLFLILMVLVVISPVFAADKKDGVVDLVDTCRNGKVRWRLSKVAAALLYGIAIVLVGFLITFLMSVLSRTPLNPDSIAFETNKPALMFTNAQFFVFSFFIIVFCTCFLVLFTLFISSRTSDLLIPLAGIAMFVGIEFAIFSFGRPYFLWNLNIFRLFVPWHLLFDSLPPFGPAMRTLIIILSVLIILSVVLTFLTLHADRKLVKVTNVKKEESKI